MVLGLIIILGSIFLFFTRALIIENQTKIITINGTSIEVEIADTSRTREKGLSDRKGLDDGRGMLFIFDSPAQYGFWMKDMNFAIDIVWIDENYRVVDIKENISPDTFPQVFYPARETKYVLELPTGAVDKYQIVTDIVIQWFD